MGALEKKGGSNKGEYILHLVNNTRVSPERNDSRKSTVRFATQRGAIPCDP